MTKTLKRLFVCVMGCILVLTSAAPINNAIAREKTECHEDELFIADPTSMVEELSMEGLESQKYLVRRPEKEDTLYTVVYDCADGNSVAYYFQYPVKYLDINGKVSDIDTSIYYTKDEKEVGRSAYNLISDKNAFTVSYSSETTETMPLVQAVKGCWTIGLSPVAEKNRNSKAYLKQQDASYLVIDDAREDISYTGVEYREIFNNVNLEYFTTYTGYKEILKLEAPIEQTDFQFILQTDGLLPKLSNTGEILLYDDESDEVGSFAPLYVYDSSENAQYTLNSYYTIESSENGRSGYLITLHLDQAFLSSPDILYPVIVDPTFSFNTSTAIDDAPIYSGIPDINQGNNYYNHLGYVDSGYQIGSLLVKFPALSSSTLFNGLSDSRINSVNYYVRKAGGSTGTTATIRAYRYTGPSWYESTVTYNSANIGNYTGSLVSSVTMSSDAWYSFDITSVAKAWKNGTANYNSGLIIKNVTNNTNVNYDRVLTSVEYGTSVNSAFMSYVTVVYNNNGTSAAFATEALAAKDFAQSVYSSCSYSRIEFAAIIYYYGGKYYYYNVHYGNPHSVPVSNSVPSGALYKAYIHTHPNSEVFSSADKACANYLSGNAYVATPSGALKKYTYTTSQESTLYTNLTYYPLTGSEKSSLVSTLSSVWYGHFVNGVCPDGFGCENMIWPNE